jgi:hypothetical protein
MTKNNSKPDIHMIPRDINMIQTEKAEEETQQQQQQQQQQQHHKLLLLNFFAYMCTQQASGTFIL